MLYIDGSVDEGGGQILRTALALSTLTNTPFEMMNIRQGRDTPGLKSQHLNCITALQKFCSAKAANNTVGSSRLTYVPGKIKGGSVNVDIGTAGSITLLLQSLLLPALFADRRSKFRIEGGTDVAWSMPIDYLREVFLPHLTKYAEIELKTEKRGYYPAGGGRAELIVKPRFHLCDYGSFLEMIDDFRLHKPKIELLEQGRLLQIKGVSHASKELEDAHVAERQAQSARLALGRLNCPINIQTQYCDTLSIGSGITLWARFSKDDDTNFNNPIILGADVLGEKGKSSEAVGEETAKKLLAEIASGACVDQYMADNLVPYLIFGGAMSVSRITPHTRTNIWTTEQFLGKMFKVQGTLIKV